ncbi:hypothetical protein [Polaribacter sp. Z022]|uniref:hypothetical protein n=1 Tax=Polaribacter sp. Z022 TaxID=2927125 RepID=UPI002020C1E6|nr:hypothetical protein [Polaribacter sp. Z022]MCL7752378.1 hypothetical protein [Polaribacter sp. Z022]
MKLSENQIQELYKFTRKHYVYFYDVQTELVDHLANDIEEIWVEYPNLSFEQARDKSFKKFGIFGFMDVVESRQKQLGTRYNRLIFKFMKDWLSIPKIIISATIFIFFYTLMTLNIKHDYLSVFMLILATIDIVLASKVSKKAKKRFKENNKKYLLEDIIFRVGAFSSILVFSNLFNLSTFLRHSESMITKIIIATIITLAILYSYITLVVIPEKAEELLEETYPEYKISKTL